MYWSGQRGDFSHVQAHEDTWSPTEWSDWGAHTIIGEVESRIKEELNMANRKIDLLQVKVTEQEEMIANIRSDLAKSYEAYKELLAAHIQLEENVKAIHRASAQTLQEPPGPPPGPPPLTGSRTPPQMPSTPGSRVPSRATSRCGTPQPVECPVPSPTRPTEGEARSSSASSQSSSDPTTNADGGPMCMICPTYDAARSDACVEGKVHTKCFDGYAREEDISAGEKKRSGSTEDDGLTWRFISRFSSMNCSLGMREGKKGLGEKLDRLAKKGQYFYVCWHNGNGVGAWAATKMVCLTCQAKIDVAHAGLPSKDNNADDKAMIAYVDNRVTQFMWSEMFITRYDLHRKVVCTVERMHPGSVIGNRKPAGRGDESDSC